MNIPLIIVLSVNTVGFVVTRRLAAVMTCLTNQTGNVSVEQIDLNAITFGAILDGLNFGIDSTKVL